MHRVGDVVVLGFGSAVVIALLVPLIRRVWALRRRGPSDPPSQVL